MDTGCRLEDQPEAMEDKKERRERVSRKSVQAAQNDDDDDDDDGNTLMVNYIKNKSDIQQKIVYYRNDSL